MAVRSTNRTQGTVRGSRSAGKDVDVKIDSGGPRQPGQGDAQGGIRSDEASLPKSSVAARGLWKRELGWMSWTSQSADMALNLKLCKVVVLVLRVDRTADLE
ncbi:uncharacterized protein RCC_08773 [Ramularia collo-cygni]|uniref:Uncharacterized protein n=1 Tax=Ramularia collo-cygni TaxID=112498 RepID=A0A2D3V4Z7_9PEZI|nr:uncharacterized protein RCC_08773 [Ramularia collo-cygni]CZT23063.1 uncharacterized protein RCC_08773 [Ramularia collo-cygni]